MRCPAATRVHSALLLAVAGLFLITCVRRPLPKNAFQHLLTASALDVDPQPARPRSDPGWMQTHLTLVKRAASMEQVRVCGYGMQAVTATVDMGLSGSISIQEIHYGCRLMCSYLGTR